MMKESQKSQYIAGVKHATLLTEYLKLHNNLSDIEYDTMQYSTVLYNAMQYGAIPQHLTELSGSLEACSALSSVLLPDVSHHLLA
jgi:hypothetical protein